MAAILSLLKAHKLLAALGAAILALATAFGVQTWRIGQLQQEVGAVGAQLYAAVAANESNQTTITALVTAAKHNAARYEAEKRRADEAAARADEIEDRNREQADEDIDAIEQTDNDCARQPLPDDIRDRLRHAGGDGNGRHPGSAGAANSATGQSDAGL